MRLKSIIEWGFALLLFVALASVAWFHQRYDNWLAHSVEASLQPLLGSPLQVDAVTWQASQSLLQVEGLRWFNLPPSQQPWLELPQFTLQVPTGAWQGQTLVMDALRLNGLKVFVRQEGLSTNLQALRQALDSYRVPAAPQPGSREAKAAQFYRIDRLELLGVELHLTTLRHGDHQWTLPPLVLDNPNREPLTAAALSHQLVSLLLHASQEAVSQRITALHAAAVAQSLEQP
jgi:hypothetical protein